MKLVEVIVDRGAIGDLRDALRDLGVRTLRIGEAGEKQEHFIRGISGQATESESSGHPRAKVSVAVPDDIADSSGSDASIRGRRWRSQNHKRVFDIHRARRQTGSGGFLRFS